MTRSMAARGQTRFWARRDTGADPARRGSPERWMGAKGGGVSARRLKNRASFGSTNRKISYRPNMPVNHRRVNAAHTFSDSCSLLPLPRQLLLPGSRVSRSPFCSIASIFHPSPPAANLCHRPGWRPPSKRPASLIPSFSGRGKCLLQRIHTHTHRYTALYSRAEQNGGDYAHVLARRLTYAPVNTLLTTLDARIERQQ